jgi:YD repeat-containing protein
MDVVITEDTVLEFEFKSSGEMPDFNGIGFSETNDEGASKNQTFTFNGWQNYSVIKSIRYSGDGEWQRIKIRAGDYFQGSFHYLMLSNDADKNQPTDVRFKNIKIYESPQETIPFSSEVFQMQNGLLAIEAEHASKQIARSDHEWQMRTDHVGTSGEGYLKAGPDIGFSRNKKYKDVSAEVQYQFYVDEPGVYYVWIRGLSTSASDDSLHVGLNGEEIITSDRINGFVRNEWSWTNATMDAYPARIEITKAGEHTLNLWMLKDGLLVDKILLSKDPNFIPQGLGPNESAQRVEYQQPLPPTLNPIVNLTNQTVLSLSGTKPKGTSLWLNDVEVMALNDSSEWSYDVSNLSEGAHDLQLTVKNAGGLASEVVTVKTKVDLTAPVIQVDSANLTNHTNYVLSYTVDGIEKTLNRILTEGQNTLNITETDEAGNESRASFVVTLDTIAPEVVFTSATLTNEANYMLTYTVDGIEKKISKTLIEGQNSFTISESDLIGNETTASLNVFLDTTPPEIIVTSKVLVNQVNYQLTYTVDGVEKLKDFVLAEGSNVLSIIERDQAGNQTTASVGVKYVEKKVVVKAPIITSAIPEATRNSSLYISGRKPAGSSLWLNGIEIVSANGSTFWSSYLLTFNDEGQHNYVLTTKDENGYESLPTSFSITYDITRPTIDNVNPINNTQVSKDGFIITGRALDNLGVKEVLITLYDEHRKEYMTVSESANYDSVTGEFTYAVSPNLFTPGRYLTAQIQIRDFAGNLFNYNNLRVPVQFDPAYDLTPPLIKISEPVTNSEVASTGFYIKGTVEDVASNIDFLNITVRDLYRNILTVSKKDLEIDPETGGWSFWIEPGYVTPGTNPYITIEAKDSNGNISSRPVSPHVKEYPKVKVPVIVFTSFQITNNKSYTLKYTIDDIEKTKDFMLNEGENALNITEYDAVGNEITKTLSVTLDTTLPEILLTSKRLVNQSNYQLTYVVDGTEKTETYSLREGNNTFAIVEIDNAGNQATQSVDIVLDTTAPQIEILSGLATNQQEYDLVYEVDGVEKSMAKTLVEGENEIEITEIDLAGNESRVKHHVYYDQATLFNQTQTLSDGTLLTFNENGLEQETLPSGESIFYAASRVEKLVYPDGAAIHFSNNNKQALQIFDSSGQLVEEIDQPVPTPLDESLALKLSLEGGMEVYYINAEAVEYRTRDGVRITDFILGDQNQFQEAYVSYPDGTLEIIRHGFMIRKISSAGSVMDYSPQGKVLRENLKGIQQTYTYFYDADGKLIETRVISSEDTEVVYDASGLLKTIHDGEQFIFYEQNHEIVEGVEVSVITLDPTVSVGVREDSLIRGEYWQNNAPKHLTFQNGNQIFYDASGKLLKTLNASDEETAFDFNQTLNVTKNGTRFSYNQSGFLESIKTDQGTITRLAIDQNGDGEIAGDEVSGLILETLDGSKLRDFELDADGNIVKGILETKAGVKQRIENGILTGFEMVDGKFYGVADGKATLQKWEFIDGSRAIYGGGTILEILYPDGSRFHTIGTKNKEVVSYTQELADGTKRVYEDGKMVKLITNQGHQIIYNLNGEAVSVILNDASELGVIRKLDAQGNLESILFKSGFENHQFSAQGELEGLLKDGVHAEIANDEITRINTRFASIESPEFNEEGVLNGTFQFVDGTIQTVNNGILESMTMPNGSIVRYQNGLIQEVTINNHVFKFSRDDDQKFWIEFQENGETKKEQLISYLLTHPNEELESIFLVDRLENKLKQTDEIFTSFAGEETLQFRQWMNDSVRGDSIYFSNLYKPEWSGITKNSEEDPGFITSVMNNRGSWVDQPAFTSQLIDINGDGLPDRVSVANPGSNFWWVQLNDGLKFQPAIQWTGIESIDGVAKTETQRYYAWGQAFVLGDLVDINGDGRVDRVLNKLSEEGTWLIQLNNGSGFDASIKVDNIERMSYRDPYANYALEGRDSANWKHIQEEIADLIDLDGDGLKDRVFRPLTEPYTHWIWQKNIDGTSFADALLWEGVDTSIHSEAIVGSALSFYEQTNNSHYREGIEALNAFVERYINRDWLLKQCSGGYRGYYGQCAARAESQLNEELNQIVSQYGFGQYYALTVSVPHFRLDGKNIRDFQSEVNSRVAKIISDVNDLRDLNGDGRTDRIFVARDGKWHWQKNNGAGFDGMTLWDDAVRAIPGLELRSASGIHAFNGWDQQRDVLIELVDVTGDGLPDRVTLNANPSRSTVTTSWWVEENTGAGFKDAVEWTGIAGANSSETAISQNKDHAHKWEPHGGRSPMQVNERTGLYDMNSDGILDRLIYKEGTNQYLVQFGTGRGFLPVEPIKMKYVEVFLPNEMTSLYDMAHISLRADQNLSGKIRITLDDASTPDTFQEWFIEGVGAQWQDFYLPLDIAKNNASKIKVEYVSENDINTPIYLDNITFVRTRADASKDWLDRLLAEENILSEIHSDRTQTLSQFLGLTETDVDLQMNWNQFFSVEQQIDFNNAGQVESAKNLYGTVTHFEGGKVKESVLEDGTKITFNQGESIHQQTQTVTHIDSSVETLELNYGRVRTVSKANQSTLQYFYEFDKQGREITVIFDPATGVTEKYLDHLVLSRLKPNGILTQYTYDKNKELQKTEVLYKGRVRDTFYHGISARGNTTLTTEIGVVEEYDDEGNILFHTTPDGYRYEHSFENASKVVTTFGTETEILSDGSEITIQVPIVTLTEDIESEKIHRSRLVAYNTVENEEITYDGAKVKTIKLADDTLITFDQATREQKVNPETGKVELVTRIEDATVLHADGTITEFKGGLPLSVTSATGRVISLVKENDHFISTQESVSFHYEQALKIWNETVVASWNRFQLPSQLVVKNETTLQGELITQNFAEGAVEIYEDGKIAQVLSEGGERLIRYDYDESGKIKRIELEGTRRNLESVLLRVRADTAVEKQKALSYIAEREQVINHAIEGEYVVQRDQLIKIRSRLEANQSEISGISVKGGSAKGIIGNALTQIQDGINQVNQALAQLATARVEALEKLTSQIQKASEDVETQTEEAYSKIQIEQDIAEAQILEREISPIIYFWYREILGRDASKQEYAQIITTANYETGEFGLTDLISELYASDEYIQRDQEVRDIKSNVQKLLLDYKILSEEAKQQFAASLGIPLTDVITLNDDEVNAMLEWILKQPIHFGQSAYIALEKMLSNSEKDFNRLELATHLILVDLFTGTLTPAEQSDLVLSVYAMRLTAKHFGLDMHGLALSYNGLKAMFEDACPQGIAPDVCDFELIVHVDGNHYIVVTGFTTDEIVNAAGETMMQERVHFMDPGVGPESIESHDTLSRSEFLETWLTTADPDDGVGYAISPRAPPAELANKDARHLTTDEQMRVRGAFFGLIALAVILIAKAVIAAVAGVIAAITAVITAIAGGLTAIGAGFSGIISSITALNFGGVLAGLGQIASGIGQILGAVYQGFAAFGTAFTTAFGAPGLLGSLSTFGGIANASWGALTANGLIQATVLSSAIGYAFQGAGVLLEKIGVSPKIAGSITSLGKTVVGVGLLATGNPVGLITFTTGVSDFLNTHFEISPFVNNLINVGTATLGAFAGGAFNPGEGFGALEVGFVNGFDVLKTNLVNAGLFALGDRLGIDGNILSLASVPLRAGIGGILSGGSGGSILQAIGQSLSSPEFLTGAVSIGANIALDKVGAPVFAKDLVSGFINELGKASIKKTGSTVPTWGDLADEVFDKVGGMIKRIGTGIKTVVGNVVSFASNVIEKGIEKTAALFSGAFNREVQEVVTSVAVAGPLGIGGEWVKTAPPYDSGNGIKTVSYKSVDGGATLSVQSIAGSDEVVVTKTENGVTTTNRYTKLQMDDAGNISFETATIQDARADGSIVTQLYVKNELRAWLIEDENGVVIMRSEGAHDSDGNLKEGNLEARQPSYDIRQPSYDIPAPEEKPIPLFYSGFQVNFTVSGGKVASAEVLSSKAAQSTMKFPEDPKKTMYILANGIGNEETGVAPAYMYQLEYDMVRVSDDKLSAEKDIIVAPALLPDEFLKSIFSGVYGLAGVSSALQKMRQAWNTFQTKAGTNDKPTWDIRDAIKSQLGDDEGLANLVRPTVGVGYSGGFVPLVEAITNGEYTPKSFVGLGAALFGIGDQLAQSIVNLAEQFERPFRDDAARGSFQVALGLLGATLKFPFGLAADAANAIVDRIERLYDGTDETNRDEKMTELYEILEEEIEPYTLANWDHLSGVGIDLMVNVYGSKDILTTGDVLGGFVKNLGEFHSEDRNKPLFNIEIVGADHYDYINGIKDYSKEEDSRYLMAKNQVISNFIAQLILVADDKEELREFLSLSGVAQPQNDARNTWIVEFPGIQ